MYKGEREKDMGVMRARVHSRASRFLQLGWVRGLAEGARVGCACVCVYGDNRVIARVYGGYEVEVGDYGFLEVWNADIVEYCTEKNFRL